MYCGWLIAAMLAGAAQAEPADAAFADLFGYHEQAQSDIRVIPQWAGVLEREATASSTWQQQIADLADLSPDEQLHAVNAFGNAQRYVIDADNYGAEDYWAMPAQFIANGGDCEDYALFKLYALRALGWSADALRLVIVQDTQLGQPHAILAVATADGMRILDNQFEEPVRDTDIAHYAPVYSLSGRQWWMHLPAEDRLLTDGLTAVNRSPSPSLRPAPAADLSPSGTRR